MVPGWGGVGKGEMVNGNENAILRFPSGAFGSGPSALSARVVLK